MTDTAERWLVTTVVFVVGIALLGASTAVLPAAAQNTTDNSTADSWWGQLDEASFDSAGAEVAAETYRGDVTEVTFSFDAPPGRVVMLRAGYEVEFRFATGHERETTVDIDRWGWPVPEEYPVNVSAQIIGAERCTGTITANDTSVELCEDEPSEPAPAYDVGVDATSPVTEGDVVTVDATVENTGDAEGTEEATVSIADQETTETVALGPGNSTTVSLDWQTEAGDAGTYEATAGVGDAEAATEVTVESNETGEPTGTVEGTVTDAETGDAIGGATVSAGDVETTTADDGSYSLTLTDGDYALEVSADGYESASQNVSVTADETTTADVALDAVETAGDVEGTVTDSETADAIEGATVSAGDAETTTDANGSYSLTLEEGDHTVEANAEGYESTSQVVTVTAGETATADFALSPTETEGTLSGAVTDNETGDAIAGATVSAGGTETTTADDGSYSLTLAEGNYTLQVSADGYDSTSQDVTVTAGEATTADAALTATPDPANFQLSNLSVNSPTVGEPFTAEATVENTGGQEGTQTVSLGAGDLGSDSQEVTLAAGASTTVSLSVATSEGDAGTYTAELTTADDTTSTEVTVAEAVTEGTVEGAVTDADSGDAIAGATVSAGGAETTTGDDGSYSLTLEGGDYTVEANADGYESASQDVSVTAGETSTADLALASEQAGPQEFTSYVRGTEAYLHTAVNNESTNPIEFTECRDGEPTDAARDEAPDYLLEPECTTIDGTYYPSNNSWTGSVEFPAVVQERVNDVLGDIYVKANITTDRATGTMNLDTGEITMDSTVDIGVNIYDVEQHGVDFSEAGDPITNPDCRIPSLDIELSTGKSFDSGSSFTDSGSVEGQPLGDDGTAYLVSNDYSVDSATECGDIGGLIDLDGRINAVMGLPSDAPNNEVAFDIETDLAN